MKLQKLTIHNLASIEDAEIDFEAYPIAGSEVFLITGKTGSGKSTILDAICLTLYADTPRMDNTKMQGDTADGDKTVKIDDPRQLMRRGTAEAYATLTFTGSNGVHYKATWSVSRAHKKATGNLQAKEWFLTNLDTGLTLNKDKEIEAEIKQALGLDFKQFCRTTMLAQGEFTRFLNSKDDEKAEILEKITGVNDYSRIGAKVYALTSKKEQAWREAQLLVSSTHILSDEETAKKKEELATFDTQYAELKKKADCEEAKSLWIKTESELLKKTDEARIDLDRANQVIQSDDFRQKEALVKEWNDTIDARAWMTEIKRAEAVQSTCRKTLDILNSEYAKLLGGLEYSKCKRQKLGDKIKDIDILLESEREKLSVCQNEQSIVGHLNTIASNRIAIAKSKETIDKEKKTLTEELIPASENARQNHEKATVAIDGATTNLKTKEEELSALELPTLRDRREKGKELTTRIATARDRIEILSNETKRLQLKEQELSEKTKALETLREESAKLDEPIRDAKLTMDVRNEDLERQRDTIDRFAKTMRLKLHVGDTCPVCRQKVTAELPHEEELAELVSGLQEAYNQAEKKYKELVDEKNKKNAEIKSYEENCDRDKRNLNEDKTVALAEQRAREACTLCGVEKIDDSTIPSLDELETKSNHALAILDKRIAEGETKENEVKELRQALDKMRNEAELLRTERQKAENAVAESNARIKIEESLVESKKNVINVSDKEVQQLVGSVEWGTDWRENPMEFAQHLRALAKKYSDKANERQQYTTELQEIGTICDNVSLAMEEIIKSIPGWKETLPTETAETDNLLARANNTRTNVATTLSQLKNAEESLASNKGLLKTFLETNSTMTMERMETLNTFSSIIINSENDQLVQGRNNAIAKKSLLDSAMKELETHRETKPVLSDDDTPTLLEARIGELDRLMREIVERKGAIGQELKTDQETKMQLGVMVTDAEQKKEEYLKWSRLNQLIGDATGNKFRKIAQSYVLSSLIHSANSYMKSLTDRYTLKVNPGTFVIMIEDAYQGYVSRAASTISGGESFLVSLSLALALSDIGQTLSVDTLFIDEGFGTLSGEPLQNAINTLRSLHNKGGRNVGIISHVEELRERIPVQIQVNQEGNSSRSTIAIVP